MLIAYEWTARLRSPLILAVLAALALIMPWLLRNSFRFRLYNTSWRGTRFHFRGSVAGSYRVFLLNGFLAMITFYIMAPFMHQRLKAYQHDNTLVRADACVFSRPCRPVLPGLFVLVGGDGGLFSPDRAISESSARFCTHAIAAARRAR